MGTIIIIIMIRRAGVQRYVNDVEWRTLLSLLACLSSSSLLRKSFSMHTVQDRRGGYWMVGCTWIGKHTESLHNISLHIHR